MAKGFEMEGTVKVINEVQTFASGFSKREFVIEVEDGKFPQMVKFECLKEKTTLIDDYSIGDSVKVYFDIRGNEYNGRYFVNLNAWKLEKPGGGGAPANDGYADQSGPPSHLSEPPADYGSAQGAPSDDDIPF
ncbi:MAG: DUF3127 domain-containing protein [Verrucomicrobiales bacterium]|nr:DUF3127 domain-containing protein [Verrucomicrobiales bacterium]